MTRRLQQAIGWCADDVNPDDQLQVVLRMLPPDLRRTPWRG